VSFDIETKSEIEESSIIVILRFNHMELVRENMKRISSAILLFLLLTASLVLTNNLKLVKASSIIYIKADGSIEPPTANITTFDNITYFFTGNNYAEIVVERDDIVVDGAHHVVQGVENGTGIDISGRSNVTIKNTRIEKFQYGIRLDSLSYNSIFKNNVITDNDIGILLRWSSNNTISGNNITGNHYGIRIHRSSNNNSIFDNNITGNADSGIWLGSSSGNSIFGNNITANEYNGIQLGSTSGNSIFGNKIRANADSGIWLGSSSGNSIFGNNVTANEYNGIYLSGSTGNSIFGNNIRDHSHHDGISLDRSSYNNVSDNNITANRYGVYLRHSSDNIVYRNSIIDNYWGVTLRDSCYNNIFSGNNITEHFGYEGVRLLDSCDFNSFIGNNITRNGVAIRFRYSSYNIFRNNDLISNRYNFDIYGKALSHYIQDIDDSNTVNGKPVHYWVNRRNMTVPLDAGYVALVNCTRITVQNLTLTRNLQGIILASTTNSVITQNSITNNWNDGIVLYCSFNNTFSKNNITGSFCSVELTSSSNNKFFHNNFNSRWSSNVISDNSTNVWDDGYPSGGNYWDDHACTGWPSNGSQPYIIDEDNIDHYPFPNPLWVPEYDVTVALLTRQYCLKNNNVLIKTKLYNRGSSDDTNVELQLLINGTRVANKTIPKMMSGASDTLEYLWIPTIEGTYNVTAHISQVLGENTVANNIAQKNITVLSSFPGTYISVNTPIDPVQGGSNFSVRIRVNNVTDLYTWQVTLYFDSTTINFIEASIPPGHIFGNQTIVTPPPFLGTDSRGTYVTLGCTLLGEVPGVNGDGILSDLRFKAISFGTCFLTFGPEPVVDTFLLDTNLDQISCNLTDNIVVIAELAGDLNGDGVVDLKDVGTAALAFGSHPGHPRWNSVADINSDDIIDLRDIAIVARNFGDTYA
jgi:parallel beta-helix repeat protein